MSNVITSVDLFERNIGDGYMKIYLNFVTREINYQKGTQSFDVEVCALLRGLEYAEIEGGSSKLFICGREYSFSDSVTATLGGNYVAIFSYDDVDTAAYDETFSVRLIFNHRCERVGIYGGIDVSAQIKVNTIYYSPQVFTRDTGVTLGNDVVFTGDFLDIGYETYADIKIGELTVHSGPIGLTKKIKTSPEWLSHLPDVGTTTAYITVRSAIDWEFLPEETVIAITVTLPAKECVPDFTVNSFPFSEVGAVQALGRAVRTKSRYRIAAENAVCKYGAYVKECKITFNGVRYDGLTLDTPILTEAGGYTYSVTLTDSRGFSATKTGAFEVLDYAPPSFTAAVVRTDGTGKQDDSGGYLKMDFRLESTYAFDGANATAYYYTVKKAGDSSEGERRPLTLGQGILYNEELESGYAYEIRITCYDTFEGVTQRVYTVDCDRIELNIAKNKIGVGKIAEIENLLDCAWPIKVDGDITFTDEQGNEISLRALVKTLTQ